MQKPLANIRIGICDDDMALRQELQEQLVRSGFNVAYSGATVPDLSAATLDVLILDLRLGRTDPLTDLSPWRRTSSPAVVVYSGQPEEVLRSARVALSACGVPVVSSISKSMGLTALLPALFNASALLSTQVPPCAVEIRRAIEAGLVDCDFQPKWRLSDGAFTGCEALLRSGISRQMLPSSLLQAAEAQGCVRRLFLATLTSALRFFDVVGEARGSVVLNVNADRALAEADVVDEIFAALLTAKVSPAELCFEIIEDYHFEKSPIAMANVARLAIGGVRFALDDFGIGMSNFDRIDAFPATELKLDRSFLGRGKSGELSIASLVEHCRERGVATTLEGVETADQLRLAYYLGVDGVQGFYLSKPVPLDQLASAVEQGKRRLNVDLQLLQNL